MLFNSYYLLISANTISFYHRTLCKKKVGTYLKRYVINSVDTAILRLSDFCIIPSKNNKIVERVGRKTSK